MYGVEALCSNRCCYYCVTPTSTLEKAAEPQKKRLWATDTFISNNNSSTSTLVRDSFRDTTPLAQLLQRPGYTEHGSNPIPQATTTYSMHTDNSSSAAPLLSYRSLETPRNLTKTFMFELVPQVSNW